MTTDDEELCSSAVNRTPKSTAIAGFSSVERKEINAALFDSGTMADLITEMPKNSIPNPRIMEPVYFIVFFLTKRYRIAPIKRIKGA
jgi:hypothetical protein